MGLEEFMDIDDGEEQNDKSQPDTTVSDDKVSELENYDNFYLKDGKLIRKGLLSYDSMQDFDDTVQDKIKINRVLAKCWYPVFPHIGDQGLSEVGHRHTLSVFVEDTNRCQRSCGVTCFSKSKTMLKKIPREVVMLDTGVCEKQDVLDVLSERLGYTVEPESTVTLYVFANYKAAAQTAIVNSDIDEFTNKEYAMLTESAMREGKLDELRNKWDSKNITDLPRW